MLIKSYRPGLDIEVSRDDIELAILLLQEGKNRIEVAKEFKASVGLIASLAIVDEAEKKINRRKALDALTAEAQEMGMYDG